VEKKRASERESLRTGVNKSVPASCAVQIMSELGAVEKAMNARMKVEFDAMLKTQMIRKLIRNPRIKMSLTRKNISNECTNETLCFLFVHSWQFYMRSCGGASKEHELEKRELENGRV